MRQVPSLTLGRKIVINNYFYFSQGAFAPSVQYSEKRWIETTVVIVASDYHKLVTAASPDQIFAVTVFVDQDE